MGLEDLPVRTDRLDRLVHVLLLAALVYMLLQYCMRKAGVPFDRPPRGLLSNPTSREALQHLSHSTVIRMGDGARQIQIPSDYKNGFIRFSAGPASIRRSMSCPTREERGGISTDGFQIPSPKPLPRGRTRDLEPKEALPIP
ncbi:MAG: hypothetical protein M1313_04275 [Nitrospirae bacterium]|nr:hypothetical protein [Nitrospirota bacterium]